MVRLEPLEKEDFKSIVAWNEGMSADFLLQWSGPVYTYPLTEEQLLKFYNDYITKEKDTLFVYKIILEETGQMVGTIELDERDTVNKVGRVGRFLIGEESCRGKGIGRAALQQLAKISFEALGLNKITLGVFDFNTQAIKCYKRVGFVIEELRENYRKAVDGYWNLYDMSLSKEHYLDIENTPKGADSI